MKYRWAITAPHEPHPHPRVCLHEPERGIYAASVLPCQERLKRHKCRAPVQGHNARTVLGQFLPGLAVAVCLAGLLGGCYSFSGAREEIRQNQEQEATINREIQKEQDRESELENSTNLPATNSPSK